MCGISGIYNFSGQQITDAPGLVQRMNSCMVHRGPDDEGAWNDKAGKIFFGHRRLSIIDLSAAGHQPMTDEAGNAIVFNGEIYNYKELRAKDHRFVSDSDTEVLLHLCRAKFLNAVDELNGMYAFAYWDEEKQKLLLVRDRIGKKPLYYTVVNGILLFASEIRSLLSVPMVRKEVDQEALYHFLTFNQLSPPLTMFKNIFKLPPAGYVIAGAKGIEQASVYWDVEYQDLSKEDEPAVADNIYNLLQRSVNYRMVADVPVGAFLSGGVDSGAVVALMHAQGYKIKTYSIGFQGMPAYSELHYASKLSQKYGTDHFEQMIGPEHIREFLPEMASVFDEPLADSTAIPIYFISRLARENGTIVVQSGDGSDELFAGYNNWMKYAKLYPMFRSYSKVPLFLRKAAAALFSNEKSYAPWKEFLSRAANNEEFFWGGAKAFKESSKKKFLKHNVFDHYDSHSIILEQRHAFNNRRLKNATYTDWMCYLGLKQQIPNRYLYRMDKLGMANSIEVRCPFLDISLVNYAMSIPAVLKTKNGEPKYILKKSLERILDKEVLYRKKMGFNVPLKEWSQEVMAGYIRANLKTFCSRSGVFDEDGLRQMTEESIHNKNLTNNLYTIYFLMAWYEQWIY